MGSTAVVADGLAVGDAVGDADFDVVGDGDVVGEGVAIEATACCEPPPQGTKVPNATPPTSATNPRAISPTTAPTVRRKPPRRESPEEAFACWPLIVPLWCQQSAGMTNPGGGCVASRYPSVTRAAIAELCDPSPVDDDTDRLLIRLLGQDGRMSYADLARETGLSTSAVHQRVRRLQRRGVIVGYRAVVDPREVGLPLTALVDLTPLDPASPDDTPERLAEFTEIESCWSVAGAASYVIKVRVAEPADLEDLLARIRAAAGVSTRTTVVLSTPFEGRPPLL